GGVVGFKGTHGLVPVAGVIPLAWSLDHVGVLARSVADVALAMSVLAGRDLTPVPVSAPRLALAPELLTRASREVAAHVEAAADAFAGAGGTGSEIELPPSFRDLPGGGVGRARSRGRGIPSALVRQARRPVQPGDAGPDRSGSRPVGDRLRQRQPAAPGVPRRSDATPVGARRAARSHGARAGAVGAR